MGLGRRLGDQQFLPWHDQIGPKSVRRYELVQPNAEATG
jgi:hypothetical protein